MNYLSIFSGVAGLDEGFNRVGYKPIAHVEMDENACYTIKTRVAYQYLHDTGQEDIYNNYLTQQIDRKTLYSHIPDSLMQSVLQKEITAHNINGVFKQIDELKGKRKVDIIIGGPPCQVYSLVGRSRMGKDNVVEDKRYTLYKLYGKFLKYYQPKAFVFENVLGLLSAGKGSLIKDFEKFFHDCGYTIKYKTLTAFDYGVLQYRKRVIIVGVKGQDVDFDFPMPEESPVSLGVEKGLFSDLPEIHAGYTDTKPLAYTTKTASQYLKDTHIRNGASFVTQHYTRPHNDRDLEIYSIANKKWYNGRERLKYNDLPKRLQTHNNITAFLDRYKVVDPIKESASHTIVAHISKDGHYFIYPSLTNSRSLSVREAARIQSFPDNYYFEGGRGAAFKQIGNAVPPLMAEKIAKALLKLL